MSRYDRRIYKFTLEEDYSKKLSVKPLKKLEGKYKGKTWLEIYPSGMMIIKNGYSWDGCSPKFYICGKEFGTPDGPINSETQKPETYYASLVHDALYQFKENIDQYITRKQADKLFYQLMKENSFKFSSLYYFIVRLVGWLWWIT